MQTFLDRPLFQTDEVAAAAGIAAETLKGWIKNDLLALIRGDDESLNPGKGRARKFTLRRAIQIALTAEISRRGVQVTDASRAAAVFTDVGETGSGWTGEPDRLVRAPGELFRGDLTILRVLFPEGGEIESDVIKLSKLKTPFYLHSKVSASAILIDVNEVVRRVMQKLGISGMPQ
jgi:hypothetical protein